VTAAEGTARSLAEWAVAWEPTTEDLALAERSLKDTVAVGLAARNEPAVQSAEGLSEAGRWSVACHVLDFDDLHMETTTHISTVCVPVALASGGDERTYLAGAGVMARLGLLLGWRHYASGWHATTTSGALAAAVTAGVARGFGADQLARAMALAVPAAGGVQRSFGTDAKSLQVGFAAEAGMRAAQLVAAGASADPAAVDAWITLVGGRPGPPETTDRSAVPGGLAIKIYPCCYALQRPTAAVSQLAASLESSAVRRVVVRTPAGTVAPLIHSRPRTGLEAKFSLEYAVAAALLDDHQGFESFSDAAVRRPEAQRLVELVETDLSQGGEWLLEGEVEVEVETETDTLRTTLTHPPGSPQRPPTPEELDRKLTDCLVGLDVEPGDLTWRNGATLLRRHLTPGASPRA
jgi:2-methylcitrate dehydratase PrpD